MPLLPPFLHANTPQVPTVPNVPLQKNNNEKYQTRYLVSELNISSEVCVVCEREQTFVHTVAFVIILDVKVGTAPVFKPGCCQQNVKWILSSPLTGRKFRLLKTLVTVHYPLQCRCSHSTAASCHTSHEQNRDQV
jgi:hypothetical protein